MTHGHHANVSIRVTRSESLGFRLWRWTLVVVAVLLFAFYIGWNVGWWFSGLFAPSLLLEWTGTPAPSTGMTRSFLALIRHGDWRMSLFWNPFTFPLIGLLTWSGVELAVKFCKKQPLRLFSATATCWGVLLLLAWITKWMIGPASW